MIPYMVGKLAPNSSHLTRELVKYVPGRGYFGAVSSQNGDKYVTSPPPAPRSLNWSFVSLIASTRSCIVYDLSQDDIPLKPRTNLSRDQLVWALKLDALA